MSPTEITEHIMRQIKTAKEKSHKELDLSFRHCGLNEIPEELGTLTELHSLKLSNNSLGNLPESICKLKNLQTLEISNINLKVIPESLMELKNLQTLDISGNPIGRFPESIGTLNRLTTLKLNNNPLRCLPENIERIENLQWLEISNNKLEILPEGVGKLKKLQKLEIVNNLLEIMPECLEDLKNLQTLNISNNNLDSFPENICKLQNLQMLKLSNNPLVSLPENIGNLQDLQTLEISNNKLRGLPENIGRLVNLQTLEIFNNQLEFLPESLVELENLQTLDVSSNMLDSLPEGIGKLKNLQTLEISNNKLEILPESLVKLRDLQTLEISNNKLSNLPKDIGDLNKLMKLASNDNQLKNIPESLQKLENIQVLELASNRIKEIPDIFSKMPKIGVLTLRDNKIRILPESVGNLPCLSVLWVGDNQLISVPKNLGSQRSLGQQFEFRGTIWFPVVSIKNNKISELPESLIKWLEEVKIDQSSGLEGMVELHGNPLGVPPEILGPTWDEIRRNAKLPENQRKKAQDPKRIARYLRDIDSGNVPRLNEAKLLVVGPGGAGKTSVIEQLLEGTFTPDTKISTHGVVVSRWQGLRSDEDEAIQLNVWDFGGQEIQHSTHEFFLTERAVYLLVVNPRQDQRAQDEIYHWLDLIRMNAPDAPVIVALSKQDQFKGHVRDADSLDVVDFVPISCVEGEDAHNNFSRLTELIEREVRKLEHVSNKLPSRWMSVKSALEKDNQDVMTYADYQAKCVELEVNGQDDQELLARFLHDLGVMLNYADRIPLEETHILNPRWVTEGVYGIVLCDELKDAHGVLKESHVADLDKLVEKMLRNEGRINEGEDYVKRYTLGSCRFVLAMMEQFELCHPLGGSERCYLVPNALPPVTPPGSTKLDWQGALLFELRYTRILPTSVFSRFLVHIEARPDMCDWLWREGIVSKANGCQYQVTMHDRDKQIRVAIKGDDQESRVAVLEMIRNALTRANQGKKGLDPIEWIPLPDDPKVGVERDMLIELALAGESTYIVKGSDGKLKKAVVEDLLEAIGEPRLVRELTELLQKAREEETEVLLKKLALDFEKEISSLGLREIAQRIANAATSEGWESNIIGVENLAELLKVSQKGKRGMTKLLEEEANIPTEIVASEDADFTPSNCRRVIHLSDLHFTNDTTPDNHLHALAKDLNDQGVDSLDAVVISGDFKDKADLGGFDKAKEFIQKLCKKFKVKTKEGLIIVPGNHDVQDLARAYDPQRKKPEGLPEHHVYPEGRLFNVRNTTEHRKRFKPFSEKLHKPLLGKTYPLDPTKQGFVKTYPDLGLQFLLLNSAWELDEFARSNANILPESLLTALDEADREAAGKNLIRIGVWHHAIHTAPNNDCLKNSSVLCEHLQKYGFEVGLHGDVHKPENHLIGYLFPETRLHIVGAGSFGSPDSGISHATPRLYNLLLIKDDGSAMRVHTRAQETSDGGWDAWAKWPGPDPEGRYGYFDIIFNE